MRIKIEGTTFITVVLRYQVSLSNVSRSQDAIAASFNFPENAALIGNKSLAGRRRAQTVSVKECERVLRDAGR